MLPRSLSPEEVASLLDSSQNAARAGEQRVAPPPLAIPASSLIAESAPASHGTSADAPRPATGSASVPLSLRARLQRIGVRHARIADDLTAALEKTVGDAVAVQWLDCEAIPFGQLLWTMAPPTCLGIANANGESLALHVELHLLFSLLDRLLNGRGSLPPDLRRPLTEVEQRLALRILRPLAAAWQGVWSAAPREPLAVGQVLSHPQRLQAWTPETPLVVNRYRVTGENLAGQIQLVAPLAALTDWLDAAADGMAMRLSASGDRPSSGAMPGEWTIQLADQQLSAADLQGLQVGDLLATDHPLSHPLVARAESGERTAVRMGLIEGQQVVRRADG